MTVELLVGEKQTNESKKAIIACNDYLRMGTGRSLAKLVEVYQTSTKSIPTKHIATLKEWSSTYGWQERADKYDAAIEEEKNEVERQRRLETARRRKDIMESGVALDYERVERLKRLADEIERQIYYQIEPDEAILRLLDIHGLINASEGMVDKGELSELARMVVERLDPKDPKNLYPNLWARNVKSLAGGRLVETVAFNTALLSQYQSLLDDIAKETGGRRQRNTVENIDYSKLTDEQLERIAAGEDPVQVILSGFSGGES